ncbi:unnamed protein product [Clavelina lepadiformis]|uniref:Uncharacterized protein n=1 Tax=Clavelina lepadiformis TaxID=159417 RepID=A0ABP0GIP6_CLALP
MVVVGADKEWNVCRDEMERIKQTGKPHSTIPRTVNWVRNYGVLMERCVTLNVAVLCFIHVYVDRRFYPHLSPTFPHLCVDLSPDLFIEGKYTVILPFG